MELQRKERILSLTEREMCQRDGGGEQCANRHVLAGPFSLRRAHTSVPRDIDQRRQYLGEGKAGDHEARVFQYIFTKRSENARGDLSRC